jgi:hypothetical protein
LLQPARLILRHRVQTTGFSRWLLSSRRKAQRRPRVLHGEHNKNVFHPANGVFIPRSLHFHLPKFGQTGFTRAAPGRKSDASFAAFDVAEMARFR